MINELERGVVCKRELGSAGVFGGVENFRKHDLILLDDIGLLYKKGKVLISKMRKEYFRVLDLLKKGGVPLSIASNLMVVRVRHVGPPCRSPCSW